MVLNHATHHICLRENRVLFYIWKQPKLLLSVSNCADWLCILFKIFVKDKFIDSNRFHEKKSVLVFVTYIGLYPKNGIFYSFKAVFIVNFGVHACLVISPRQLSPKTVRVALKANLVSSMRNYIFKLDTESSKVLVPLV